VFLGVQVFVFCDTISNILHGKMRRDKYFTEVTEPRFSRLWKLWVCVSEFRSILDLNKCDIRTFVDAMLNALCQYTCSYFTVLSLFVLTNSRREGQLYEIPTKTF
jgi:hypothetical protein